MKKKNRYIELFAGCGGLSLGLESCGWELELANELSPMAAETFAYNLLATNIKNGVYDINNVCTTKDVSELKNKNWADINLAIGDVVELVSAIEKKPELQKRFKGLDLISGGPPCQGFSMAGKRKERDPKNKLPYAFVDLVRILQPRTVILENVEGILRPFKNEGGVKKPWLEVAKAFASIGYAPICFLLNAKYFGIPQNRPRFILLGIRRDLEQNVMTKLEQNESIHARSRFQFGFDLARQNQEFIQEFSGYVNGINLDVVDMTTYDEPNSLKKSFNLSNLYPEVHPEKIKTVLDGISDLRSNGKITKKTNPYILKKTLGTPYSLELNEIFSNHIQHPINHTTGLYNHELRKHSRNTQLRFFLIQEAAKHKNGERKMLEDAIRGKADPEIAASKLWNTLKRKKITKSFGITSESSLCRKITELRSKKHIQRALKKDEPAPAQLTIPDDLCHYDGTQQRVLSVREMARLQSFPDKFVFRSKVTTGGKGRKSEVPQYTQVGNAVPPLLGRAIGILLNEILKE